MGRYGWEDHGDRYGFDTGTGQPNPGKGCVIILIVFTIIFNLLNLIL